MGSSLSQGVTFFSSFCPFVEIFLKIDVTLDCQNIKRVLRILNLIIENVLYKIYEKANLRSDFRKKKSPWLGLEPMKVITMEQNKI